MTERPKFPGERITANGNQLVSYHTEARISPVGYPGAARDLCARA